MKKETVSEAVKWGIHTLKSAGFEEDVRLETELILAHLMKWTRIQIYTRSEDPLSCEQQEQFRFFVEERKKHVPLAYLLGYREFYGLSFHVTPEVLIPRPETEILVEEAIRLGAQLSGSTNRLLDLGTGSGCIALSLLKYLPEYTGDLLDISEKAIAIARQNADTLELTSRVQFFHGDLFEMLPSRSYSLILSNPPYIAPEVLPFLQAEVRLFEPYTALFSPDHGFSCLKKILISAISFLESPGALLLEMGQGQWNELLPFARQCGYDEVRILKDLAGVERVLICEQKRRS